MNQSEIKKYEPGIWEYYEDISQNRGQIEGKAEPLGYNARSLFPSCANNYGDDLGNPHDCTC